MLCPLHYGRMKSLYMNLAFELLSLSPPLFFASEDQKRGHSSRWLFNWPAIWLFRNLVNHRSPFSSVTGMQCLSPWLTAAKGFCCLQYEGTFDQGDATGFWKSYQWVISALYVFWSSQFNLAINLRQTVMMGISAGRTSSEHFKNIGTQKINKREPWLTSCTKEDCLSLSGDLSTSIQVLKYH